MLSKDGFRDDVDEQCAAKVDLDASNAEKSFLDDCPSSTDSVAESALNTANSTESAARPRRRLDFDSEVVERRFEWRAAG